MTKRAQKGRTAGASPQTGGHHSDVELRALYELHKQYVADLSRERGIALPLEEYDQWRAWFERCDSATQERLKTYYQKGVSQVVAEAVELLKHARGA